MPIDSSKDVLGGGIATPAHPPKLNPAAQSLNKFGGMINENIVQPVKNVLGYPGQVIAGTVNQAASGLESLGNTVKENYNKDRDYSQLAKSSLDPTNPYGNNYNPETQPVPGMGNYGVPTAEQVSQSVAPPLGGEQTATGISKPNDQGVYPDGSLEPGSPAFLADLQSYGNETLRQETMQDQRESQHSNLTQTEPYELNKDLTTDKSENPKQEQGAPQVAGDDYYSNTDIKSAFEKGAGGFNEMDKSKLVDENGFPAYVDGKQVNAPLFNNTYMKKRYGEDVHKPRTEQERIAEGEAVNDRRDKYLASLERGRGSLKSQRLGLNREVFDEGQRSAKASALALGQQNNIKNSFEARKIRNDEYKFDEGQRSAKASALALGQQNNIKNSFEARKIRNDEYKMLNPNLEMIKTFDYDDYGNKSGESVKGAFNPANNPRNVQSMEGLGAAHQEIGDLGDERIKQLNANILRSANNPKMKEDIDDFLAQYGMNIESYLEQKQGK